MVTKEELIESHNHGFGGSDAKMFLKIGQCGVGALSATELRRVLQVLGKYQPRPFEGNIYTDAGHQFEEWMRGKDSTFGYKQEFKLCGGRFGMFNVFAHADYYNPELQEVIECKYSQNTTDEVESDYAEQLQWYYMLGAQSVVLCHGWGSVFPFEVEGVEYRPIEPNDDVINTIWRGCEALATAIDEGYFNDMTADEVAVTQLDMASRDAVATIVMATAEIKRYEQKMAAARDLLCKAMEQSGILSITGEGFKISYVSPTTKRSFDSKKAIKDFPELDNEKYYKTSNVKASIRITMKENTPPQSK